MTARAAHELRHYTLNHDLGFTPVDYGMGAGQSAPLRPCTTSPSCKDHHQRQHDGVTLQWHFTVLRQCLKGCCTSSPCLCHTVCAVVRHPVVQVPSTWGCPRALHMPHNAAGCKVVVWRNGDRVGDCCHCCSRHQEQGGPSRAALLPGHCRSRWVAGQCCLPAKHHHRTVIQSRDTVCCRLYMQQTTWMGSHHVWVPTSL